MINKFLTDVNNVQALDDEPNDVTGLTAAQLKAVFDKAPGDLKTYINGLVDVLNSVVAGSSGAENIGSAPIPGISGATVYDQIKNMLAVAQAAQSGTILPGTITDEDLSNAVGAVKDILNRLNTVYTTTHNGNAYSVTVPNVSTYTDGYPLCVKFDADSTGNATIALNALGQVSIIDSLKNPVSNIKANTVFNMRYVSANSSFQLLGKGGGGNATTGDLLLNKTATVDTGQITGTIPNMVGSNTIITPGNIDQVIPQGYFDGTVGSGKVKGDSNLIPGNIPNGISIFGVIGTNTNKKWASGTTTSPGGTIQTKDISNSVNAKPYVSISGLAFTPSLIIVTVTSSTNIYMSIYKASGLLNYAGYGIVHYFCSGAYLQDYGGLSVSNGSFTLAVNVGTTYDWIAIE